MATALHPKNRTRWTCSIHGIHCDLSLPLITHHQAQTFCVGAVLVDGGTGKILSTFPGTRLHGHGQHTTRAKECCYIEVTQGHGVSAVSAGTKIWDVIPAYGVPYMTMKPPWNAQLNIFIVDNDGKKRLEKEGFGFEMVKGNA